MRNVSNGWSVNEPNENAAGRAGSGQREPAGSGVGTSLTKKRSVEQSTSMHASGLGASHADWNVMGPQLGLLPWITNGVVMPQPPLRRAGLPSMGRSGAFLVGDCTSSLPTWKFSDCPKAPTGSREFRGVALGFSL